ncbi:MAG: SET domain-containing protein-lysine N-methyltransferase, partial [bacterium]
GYGMLYNHQDVPNTKWHFDYPNLIADVIAERDRKANEEIFVSYGTKYFLNKEKKTSNIVPEQTNNSVS